MRIALLLLLVFYSIDFVAQEKHKKQHRIDIEYTKCLNNPENQTTFGMVNCAIEAQKAWEAEVDEYYKLLLSKVPEETKPLLKKSQLTWQEYKRCEFKFSTEMYLSMEGTMWQIVAADNKTEFVKQRALLLKSHYETLLEKDE